MSEIQRVTWAELAEKAKAQNIDPASLLYKLGKKAETHWALFFRMHFENDPNTYEISLSEIARALEREKKDEH